MTKNFAVTGQLDHSRVTIINEDAITIAAPMTASHRMFSRRKKLSKKASNPDRCGVTLVVGSVVVKSGVEARGPGGR